MNQFHLNILNIQAHGTPCAVSIIQFRQLCALHSLESCLIVRNKENETKQIKVRFTEQADNVILFEDLEAFDITCNCPLCE